jgi:hypothetical protein
MHMCHNRRTSSRSDVEVDLESHVHGNRACVVWGRADEKGPNSWYLVSRLFHGSYEVLILIAQRRECASPSSATMNVFELDFHTGKGMRLHKVVCPLILGSMKFDRAIWWQGESISSFFSS